jgi:hypothetical protein
MLQSHKLQRIGQCCHQNYPCNQNTSIDWYDGGKERLLSHAKISRGFVKNRLKITSETKEWQTITLKPDFRLVKQIYSNISTEFLPLSSVVLHGCIVIDVVEPQGIDCRT